MLSRMVMILWYDYERDWDFICIREYTLSDPKQTAIVMSDAAGWCANTIISKWPILFYEVVMGHQKWSAWTIEQSRSMSICPSIRQKHSNEDDWRQLRTRQCKIKNVRHAFDGHHSDDVQKYLATFDVVQFDIRSISRWLIDVWWCDRVIICVRVSTRRWVVSDGGDSRVVWR